MKDLIGVAKIPVRTIVIAYAVIQALFYMVYYIDKLHYRLAASLLLIFLVIFFTSLKGLSRLQLSIFIPLSISAVELTAVSLFVDGNRLIYIFLIGASLVSFLYVNVAGLFVMTFFTSAAVVILLFVFDIRLLGSEFAINYELFNFIGMFFIFIVVLMIGKFSVGMLSRSERTGLTFNKVLEGSSSLIVIVNNQARVEYISKSFAQILDIEKQEYAVNLPFADLFPSIELKYFFGELLERYGTIETTFEIKANNNVRSFILHSIPMNRDGHQNGIPSIARFFDCVEITPIIESQRTAEAATRSKSEFLAMMSHEIRTPLNAIIGIAQIEMQDRSLQNGQMAAYEKIHSSGNNLLGIINDILDMSKIETGKLQFRIMEYDMPSLINDTVQLNIVRIGSKPIEFKLDINEELPSKLYGDELRLKQVLNNLLSNAIKYTKNGHVKLTAKHEMIEDYVMLSFSVEDTGQGMRNKDKDRLFTEYLRFNTEANRNTEGTGLGLNITQKLVEMMNGKISVESEWGKGSIFKVTVRQHLNLPQGTLEYIPIGKDLAEKLRTFTFSSERQGAMLQITREPMPYGSVLVVDDVDTNLFVAEGLLKPYKLKIETANSGFAAIGKIKSGKIFDMIFMDHMMPVMDGIETTRIIREWEAEQSNTYKRVPIIALTANALAGNNEMFAKKDFDGFIPKPIDINLLNTILNKFIRDKNPEEAKKYKPETVSYTASKTEKQKISSKIIKVFCQDAQKAIKTLKDSFFCGDIKLFTITAHAMKSALANILEHEASEQAFALENAGIKNNMDYIKKNTDDFLNTLKYLIDKYKTPEVSGTETINEDSAYLFEQLKIIKTACESYDDDTAYAALDKLNKKAWSAKTSSILEQIRDMLYIYSDFDGVVKQIETLL